MKSLSILFGCRTPIQPKAMNPEKKRDGDVNMYTEKERKKDHQKSFFGYYTAIYPIFLKVKSRPLCSSSSFFLVIVLVSSSTALAS